MTFDLSALKQTLASEPPQGVEAAIGNANTAHECAPRLIRIALDTNDIYNPYIELHQVPT
ncbi:hypothetical protein GGQ68_001241 [Sagittula marina]|uniref:Uncharacterized protein n=1 Tax=Sagittula marina TaxID=943940 RepID=A0A7W6DKI6_9RHOB|nr:hypothetical protein [Sagittula marina]MBB3984925.1 hypothetical protein [Sagittula marina]